MAQARKLSLRMQKQKGKNWCWAANASSVSQYYQPNSKWTQCSIASVPFNPIDCCQNINACDKQWYLHKALQITDNFNSPIIAHNITREGIKAEIDKGRVICTRIEWANGDGHFVSIIGYDDSGDELFIYVEDPYYGESFINVRNFAIAYNGNGKWTTTFLTQPKAEHMIKFTNIDSNLLAKASATKLLLAKEQNTLFKAKNQLPLKQEIYIIDFRSLIDGDEPRLIAGGIRILESVDQAKQFLFDFDGSTSTSSLQQVISDKNYRSKYLSLIARITKEQSLVPESYSLDLIRGPEFKLEALWLHSNTSPKEDQFIPVISDTILESTRSYTRDVFFGTLKKQAALMPFNDDKLIGK